jgi:hypothetical protein
MFRQHYIAALLHPIASFLILVILSVFSIKECMISGRFTTIVLSDNLPYAWEHILAGSHALLLEFSFWNGRRC